MQTTRLMPAAETPHEAPASLLGHNLEMLPMTADGLSPERLRNPAFAGLPDPQTGIAPEWRPFPTFNFSGVRYELTPGMGLTGGEAQLIHNYFGAANRGICQVGVPLRPRDRLVVRLWARAQHHPVTIRVGLKPMAAFRPDYASAAIPVTATYWKPYSAVLAGEIEAPDREAVFFIVLDHDGLVWLDRVHLAPEGAGSLENGLAERFRSLEIPQLRFPGGCISTNYHWRLGTGPQHLRPWCVPDPVFKWGVRYDFGTDEYLALCRDLGITPHVTLNIGTGTPEEAGEWAAYCRDWHQKQRIEPPPMYWQMGNEHYGSWELGNMTPALYVEALREFVPAVRRGYPGARVIGLGQASGETGQAGPSLPWRKTVIAQAGDLLDYVAIQHYACGWDPDALAHHRWVRQAAEGFAAEIRKTIEDCRGRERLRVAVTEWNLWSEAAHYDTRLFHEPYDTQHLLYAATMLHHFARLAPGLGLACFYHLINPMGVFRRVPGGEIEETRMADLFRLYRPAFPGSVQPLAVAGPELDAGLPAVEALALHARSGRRFLFLVNWLPAEDTCCALPAGWRAGGGLMLRGRGLREPPEPVETDAAGSSFDLPPLSIARLELA